MENKFFIGTTIILAGCIVAAAVIFGFKSKVDSEQNIAIMKYRDKIRDECLIDRKGNCDSYTSQVGYCIERGGGITKINECTSDPEIEKSRINCNSFSIEVCIDSRISLIGSKK